MKFTEPIDDRIREEDRILKKYPKIFRQKDLAITQSCMPWGLDIGRGWMPLIEFVCSYTQNCIDEYKLPQLEATQVKEKFGGLRFYYCWRSDDHIPKDDEPERMDWIEDMISFAETISEHICETCGTMVGVSQTTGWIVTLCENCMKERNDKTNLNK